jgi:hypothetical protein
MPVSMSFHEVSWILNTLTWRVEEERDDEFHGSRKSFMRVKLFYTVSKI